MNREDIGLFIAGRLYRLLLAEHERMHMVRWLQQRAQQLEDFAHDRGVETKTGVLAWHRAIAMLDAADAFERLEHLD